MMHGKCATCVYTGANLYFCTACRLGKPKEVAAAVATKVFFVGVQ